MSSLLAAALAALGTALVLSWTPARPSGVPAATPTREHPARGRRLWVVGSGDVPPRTLATGAGLAVAAGAVALWWSPTPVTALAAASGAAVAPIVWRRRQARSARRLASAAWPRLLDDLRVRTGALGRPIPQALLEVGARGPLELRPAFAEAAREWSLTTDLSRALHVLKDHLEDPTADAVCETLLVAHEVGGDLDARLAALAEDRRRDLRHRAEAEARQAGARVARWFVLVVPAGMALAGSRLGEGTGAFSSPGAQLATGVAVAMIAVCWWWAGHIMRLPDRPRVFDR
jgi:tight adherence protein B